MLGEGDRQDPVHQHRPAGQQARCQAQETGQQLSITFTTICMVI